MMVGWVVVMRAPYSEPRAVRRDGKRGSRYGRDMEFRTMLLAAALPAAMPTTPAAASDSEVVLDAEIATLRREIATFRNAVERDRIDADRRREIASLVDATLDDAASRTSFTNRPWNEIGSEDGAFTLRLNVYEQFDWVLNRNTIDDTQWGFANFNTRITFSGTVIDPSWQYVIRLTMGADGTGDDEFAFIQKTFEGGWSVQAGLLTPMFSLEQALATTEVLGTTLSYVAGQFDPENANGAAVAWQGDDLRGWATLCNGWSSGQTVWVGNQRTGVLARGEWKPFGDWDDLYLFNPYPETVSDGLLFGAGGSFTWGANDATTPGVDGDTTHLTADVSWQRPGLGLMGCVYWQDAEAGGVLSGRRVAAVGQVAVMPTPEWSVYLRGEWGTVPDGSQPDLAGVTLGTSWFPNQDASIKWTIELLGMFGDTTGWRIDGDPAILQVDADQFAIRTQIQISL